MNLISIMFRSCRQVTWGRPRLKVKIVGLMKSKGKHEFYVFIHDSDNLVRLIDVHPWYRHRAFQLI